MQTWSENEMDGWYLEDCSRFCYDISLLDSLQLLLQNSSIR